MMKLFSTREQKSLSNWQYHIDLIMENKNDMQMHFRKWTWNIKEHSSKDYRRSFSVEKRFFLCRYGHYCPEWLFL